MNKVNNKRKKDSIEKIESAFIELIQYKEINQITVMELVKKANINRSTFYVNYLDIYDLADKIKEKMENNITVIYEDEIKNGYNSNDFLKLFYHIKDNQLFYKTYFKLGFDNQYNIFKYDTSQAKEYFNNENINYHIEFFKSGLNSIIKLWLKNDCKESPEVINSIIKSEYMGRNKNN